MALTTVAFHYGFLVPASLQGNHLVHAIHGRLCYFPIILGAIWFGVRGGVGVAFGIILLTLPYPAYRGIESEHLLIGEYTEMVFYVFLGLTAGILIELQRRERRRREALQQKLAHTERLSALGQMAAGLAHEIKNPLGSIQGAAEILGDDTPADPRRADLLGVLTKESRRLGNVVDHFLSFARTRPLDLAAVDVNDIVERAASQVALEAQPRGVAVTWQRAPSLPAIRADAERLHQVLLNVTLNAVAACDSGGRVALQAAGRGNGVAITVRDNGSGIAADDLPHVFDPFFTRRDTGTGLGLSISHAIVTDHGGSIDITSEVGAGTTVTIVLPRNPGAAS